MLRRQTDEKPIWTTVRTDGDAFLSVPSRPSVRGQESAQISDGDPLPRGARVIDFPRRTVTTPRHEDEIRDKRSFDQTTSLHRRHLCERGSDALELDSTLANAARGSAVPAGRSNPKGLRGIGQRCPLGRWSGG